MDLTASYNFLEKAHLNGIYPCYLSDTRTMDTARIAHPEIGSSFLILEHALKHTPESLATQAVVEACLRKMRDGLFSFYADENLLPQDTDTTAWAVSTLFEMQKIGEAALHKSIDLVVGNIDGDGVIKVYFDPEKYGRVNWRDHVALANVLYLLNLDKRVGEAFPSLVYVSDALRKGDYENGSRYYQSPDMFLYALGRLMKFPEMKSLFEDGLKKELSRRIGQTEYPLDLAMRVTTAKVVGLENGEERRKLMSMVRIDGSFPPDAIYHYGSKAGYFGSSFITTVFAIEALRVK
ncbi:hypothetical protein HZB01_02800 [Candidatus Woesearchaeota archaeon]|nr:hypothetical protein [Candidatus Woesearchaeota archaeon]